jgi:Ti-type conjugative transfer relaxase TraA
LLTVCKLAHGQEAYYLDAVASGVEDYYTGSGEAPGYWAGAGAALLGLSGEVSPGDLRAALAGRDPTTGEQRARAGTASRPRTPGFDLTFSAPKSVSVLYALGGGDTPAEVVAAHRAAVAAGIDYLERHAVFTRRRSDGVVELLKGEGLAVAAFRHRTSRAGDPQLHTHCVAANLVRSVDGRWGTLDSRSIFAHARTAGFVYQAVLRGEMTARLGVEWGSVRNGFAEVVGLPKPLLREFSQRRQEIEAQLEQRGQHSATAAQAATLDTRHAKEYGVDPEALHDQWVRRAREIGFAPGDVDAVCRRVAAPELHADEVSAALVSPNGLTARQASFDRRDAARGLCEALPPGAAVNAEALDALVDLFVDSDDVVPLNGRAPETARLEDGRAVPAAPDYRRFSTVEMLEAEQRVIDRAMARRASGGAVVPGPIVERVVASEGLTEEQAGMVRMVTSSSAGVEVVVGKAGSGKTTALRAAADAWTAAGFRVTGAAVAARAAKELQAAAGIPSTTVAQVLMDLDGAPDTLDRRSVLVVDEAGMVPTRTLDRLLAGAEAARAKVVLVGDYRQLPEIEAGGAFRALAERLDGFELHDNRRQQEQWERAALDELRSGDVRAALRSYENQGRIAAVDDARVAREAMVEAWLHARSRGERALMVAISNREVDDLNRRARARLVAAGQVASEGLTVGERVFSKGDEVICLRNDRRLGVINSAVATVESVDGGDRSLDVRLADGDRVRLPSEYLDAGHVAHAYATTIHKAQGATVDRTLLLGDDRLYREAGYVGLSRGTVENRLFAVHHDRDEALELHAVDREPPSVIEELHEALARSAAKHLAIEQRSELVDRDLPEAVVAQEAAVVDLGL